MNLKTQTIFLFSWVAACGGAPPVHHDLPPPEHHVIAETPAAHVDPPASGTARDIHFPPIQRVTSTSGLELDTVVYDALPVVHAVLVIKSGSSSDPANMPGLAHLTASMLKEGTRTKTSAQIAEAIEFLGADVDVSADEENVYVSMRCLKDQFDATLGLLADVALHPAFTDVELRKLKGRELDRLQLQSNDPNWLGARELYKAVYGTHPYALLDTTPDVVNRVRRTDLDRWHRANFVPGNAFLVVVGDVTSDVVKASADRVFAGWHAGTVPTTTYPALPTRTAPQIILVDRPESVQSVIMIGNAALNRASPDYVKLMVANQVLGGSPAARLFMDLRERRSLTYGAYSRVAETVDVGMFRASASVRNEVTGEAMSAFMEHLHRIVAEAPSAQETTDAERYLSDSFPLRIDTPGKIADLVADLRVYGLPDDYWDTFRTQIRAVSADQALASAQQYVHPDQAVIVVVGKAADIKEALRAYGAVTVLHIDGTVEEQLPAAAH